MTTEHAQDSKPPAIPPLPASAGSVNLHFRIRLCCDYGGGEKWGEWHELAMPRSKYGQLLDKILADPEVKDFEVQYSPN